MIWKLLGARPKTKETDCRRQKTCCHRHCKEYTEGTVNGSLPTPAKCYFTSIGTPDLYYCTCPNRNYVFQHYGPPMHTTISLAVTSLRNDKMQFWCRIRQMTAPGTKCRQRSTLQLTQKWVLWCELFGKCRLSNRGKGVAKLPCDQAALGECQPG
jgi:hypothetical protein